MRRVRVVGLVMVMVIGMLVGFEVAANERAVRAVAGAAASASASATSAGGGGAALEQSYRGYGFGAPSYASPGCPVGQIPLIGGANSDRCFALHCYIALFGTNPQAARECICSDFEMSSRLESICRQPAAATRE